MKFMENVMDDIKKNIYCFLFSLLLFIFSMALFLLSTFKFYYSVIAIFFEFFMILSYFNILNLIEFKSKQKNLVYLFKTKLIMLFEVLLFFILITFFVFF